MYFNTFLVSAICAVITTGSFALLCFLSEKKGVRMSAYFLAGLALIPVFFICYLFSIMNDKGISQDEASQATVKEILDANDNTMSQTKDLTPESMKHKVIILYRFGCPDCEAVYQDMLALRDKYPDKVAFVATKGVLGKNLVKRYDVKSVPSLLVIDPDDNSKAYKNDLIIDTGNGKQFNEEGVVKAIDMLK